MMVSTTYLAISCSFQYQQCMNFLLISMITDPIVITRIPFTSVDPFEACYWGGTVKHAKVHPKITARPHKQEWNDPAYFSVQCCIFEMTRRWFCGKCMGLESMDKL